MVLCGAGDSAWLKTLADEQGMADRIFFFQGLSERELIRLYGTADCYVDASNTPRACLGMSLTEAMAARLPTIAYDYGGLPEVVFHGDNGFLTPVDDIPALAEAIIRVKRLPPEERERMGSRGLEIAQELVDLNACAGRMLRELERIISSP